MFSAKRHCYLYDLAELNSLERMFLEAIDYRLVVKTEEMDNFFNLVMLKSEQIQATQFDIVKPTLMIVEDYFHTGKDEQNNDLKLNCKLTGHLDVSHSTKLDSTGEETSSFFPWDETCDSSFSYPREQSFDVLSDDSPR